MKSVMISIKPRWCELIASGKKTIEVRKTRPKCDTPFKCYIYCTKSLDKGCGEYEILNGKVIGEFVCKCIEYFNYGIQTPEDATSYLDCYEGYHEWTRLEEDSQVTLSDLLDYGNKKGLYGWHISDLKIYDKPKELSEFKKCHRDCWYTDLGLAKRDCPECNYKGCFFQRPPQSWCYVEEDKK